MLSTTILQNQASLARLGEAQQNNWNLPVGNASNEQFGWQGTQHFIASQTANTALGVTSRLVAEGMNDAAFPHGDKVLDYTRGAAFHANAALELYRQAPNNAPDPAAVAASMDRAASDTRMAVALLNAGLAS